MPDHKKTPTACTVGVRPGEQIASPKATVALQETTASYASDPYPAAEHNYHEDR